MCEDDELKQIRIDLLRESDKVLGDYNRGLEVADKLQEKWANKPLFQIAVDLDRNGYIEKTRFYGAGRFSLGSLTPSGRDFLKELTNRKESNSITNIFNDKTNIQNLQQGNDNQININKKENVSKALEDMLTAMLSLKDSYIKEGNDPELIQELNNLQKLNKSKSQSSKIKIGLDKVKRILSSQATTNVISLMSVILNWFHS